MRFGDIKLHLVSDGIGWMDGAGLFGIMPKAEWQEIFEPDRLNRVPLEQRCLVIKTDEQCILVDTGYGDKLSEKKRDLISLNGERRLLRSLEEIGVGAEEVDLVINTHLHIDHCGGNTCYGETGDLVPTFPNATYCVQRLELAEAMFPNERTKPIYLQENFQTLERSGQLRVLEGDTRLTDEVRVILAPGHTPGHQCVVVESGGCTALFLGDVAVWPIHIERFTCIPAYDVLPLVSIETKRHIAHWAIANKALLIFEHHPHILAGYLNPTERTDRFRLDPVSI